MLKGRIANEQTLQIALKRIGAVPLDKPLLYEVVVEQDGITARQRRLFWKWMSEVADQTGIEKDDIAFDVKERFLPSIQRNRLDGSEGVERKSITKLTVKEMSEFMDRTSRFVNIELGIGLTYPEDMQRK